MTKKLSLLFYTSLLLIAGCNLRPKEECTISGQFTNAARMQVYLFHLVPDGQPSIDSTKTDSQGNFSFAVNPENAGFYQLSVGKGKPVNLLLKKAERIVVNGNGKDLLHTYSVKGSFDSQLLWEYNSVTLINQDRVDSLRKIMIESQSYRDFPGIRVQLDSTYQAIYELNRRQTLSFLNQNIHSLASLLVLNRTFGTIPVVTLENDYPLLSAIDSALNKEYRTNRDYIAFHESVNRYSTDRKEREIMNDGLRTGTLAPQIALPDPSGAIKKLSSLKGKAVLVYFWASWNTASREMNVSLSGIYNQFHMKGLEILGVSLDADRKNWLDAIRRDRTSWIQVNDSAGLKSTNTLNFRIRSIPSALLLDREGKVLATELQLPEIKALLLEKL